MEILQYSLRKLIAGIPLVLGVTLISFLLIVYFGPDKTYDLLGKNPTAEEIAEVRSQLGYDRPFVPRYLEYLHEVITFDFGNSESTDEKVSTILSRTIPVSIALALPGFILGNVLGVMFALLAAYFRGRWIDKFIMGFAAIGMSISFLIAIIGFQILLSSSDGLDLFPVRGWDTSTPLQYLRYVTVPTLATVFIALGYNTRFYRAVIVEEMTRDHVRTAKAFGTPPARLFYRNILKNSMIPIVTRIVFSIPFIVISGSLLLESYFGIPGIGKVTYDAIITGDQPVLKAVVALTAILFVVAQLLTDICYRAVDPRVSLK
ncbi:MAG: ABC transporter permease [Gammaproteobacteria bacterium]|nr:ABC transporter permease [Gammaproteobacteria bacterium]MCP4088743.1 ABC transporter permease [Gammaproteobacteria bacterium]MCP4275214.1 ABC transporter permease [Gammaproteobacteria bacterium]MCP4830776.1 ABC transporter permease [Gammaproteobacteria bacterium]MCP4929565.1 ABC transporter permease [Gammaproteobacteria bacterium]